MIAVLASAAGCRKTDQPAAGGTGETAGTAVSSAEEEPAAADEGTPADDNESDGEEVGPHDDGASGEKPGSGLQGMDYAAWINSDVQAFVQSTAGEEVRLEDDFHLYVNRDWIMNTELPSGYASYDPISARSMEVDGQISDILRNPEKESDPALIHDQELVQKYYKMWMDWDARN